MKDVLNALVGMASFVFLEWLYFCFFLGIKWSNWKRYKYHPEDLLMTLLMAGMSFLVWWSIK